MSKAYSYNQKVSEEQLNYYIGYFLGLNEGITIKNQAIKLNDSSEFMNFIQKHKKYLNKTDKNVNFNPFNFGLFKAYSSLSKVFNKVITRAKLKEIFETFSLELEIYKNFISGQFNNLMKSTIPKEFGSVMENKEIRTQNHYFIGLITSFFLFSNTLKNLIDYKREKFLIEKSLLEKSNKFNKRIPAILIKLEELWKNNDGISIFWIGFIEMSLKIQFHYMLYNEDLNDYFDRISKIDDKLIKLARNFRLNNHLFTLNAIFSN